jgi:cytoskeletal protein CcmA (bactofilin family)
MDMNLPQRNVVSQKHSMVGGCSSFSLVSVLFKRRKPDEPVPASSAAPLPAGLPSAPAAQDAAPTGLDFRPAIEKVVPPSDNGLGVPPFRPAPLKDAQNMSRPPFSSAPAAPATPVSTARPATTMNRPVSRDPSERRTLVVGRGISVQGVVQDAERLVVEGNVEATMIHATELSIAPGGVFKGEVEVEDAEIAGTIDGTLTVRGSLVIRGTGRVLGTARCRRLQVEDGGQITGRMEMITDQAPSDLPVRQSAEQPAI